MVEFNDKPFGGIVFKRILTISIEKIISCYNPVVLDWEFLRQNFYIRRSFSIDMAVIFKRLWFIPVSFLFGLVFSLGSQYVFTCIGRAMLTIGRLHK